jgi:hypothetical protein
LREGETVAYGDAAFDLVSHVAPADVIKIGRDGTPAFQVAWFARRIVTINYLNNGIFSIQAGKRAGVAAFDRALEPNDGDGLGLRLGRRRELGFGLGFSHVAPLVIAVPGSVGPSYVIIDIDRGDERVRLEATKYYTARRMGWKETTEQQVTGADNGPVQFEDVTPAVDRTIPTSPRQLSSRLN